MDNERPIYEILVYSQPWHLDEHSMIDYGSVERVGFYYEQEIAVRAVKEKWCDLQDHYARAAAIREVRPGLYQYRPFKEYLYFLWNQADERWELTGVPKEVGDFC